MEITITESQLAKTNNQVLVAGPLAAKEELKVTVPDICTTGHFWELVSEPAGLISKGNPYEDADAVKPGSAFLADPALCGTGSSLTFTFLADQAIDGELVLWRGMPWARGEPQRKLTLIFRG